MRPENQDSNFNWEDLASKNNNELLNNLENFVNRCAQSSYLGILIFSSFKFYYTFRALTFAEKFFKSIVPEMHLTEDDLNVLALVQRELTEYIAVLEQAKLRDGLRFILAISKHGNQYMQSQQPWAKLKGNDEEK